jgi:hypothetical protein
MKKIRTKSIYQSALFFGIKPKMTPQAKACPIDAGDVFELNALIKFTSAVIIINYYSTGFQKSEIKKRRETKNFPPY